MKSLNAWLRYIESLHPREIELGLERVREVADRLGLLPVTATVITVAGTNGKGSCVALLEALLRARGIRVGSYTSPHLNHYNERIRLQGCEVDDQSLCNAFDEVEQARANTRLTYFEFGTLAALLLFQRAQLEVVVLEVGLGGRLDAVNIVDCDVAVLTSVDLDHMAWLGDTRDAIAREKIGIVRCGRPLVCAERNLPDVVEKETSEQGVPLYLIGREFETLDAGNNQWQWNGLDRHRQPLELDCQNQPCLPRDLAAAALQVLALLEQFADPVTVCQVLATTSLPGRFEEKTDESRSRTVLFDVAHNPAAASLLAKRLAMRQAASEQDVSVLLVLAMMADKDVAGFAAALASTVDIWYIGQVDLDRCMAAEKLAGEVQAIVNTTRPVAFGSVIEAYLAACETARREDLIVVTGSFYTVAAIREFIRGSHSL